MTLPAVARPVEIILFDLSLACMRQSQTFLHCSVALRESIEAYTAGDPSAAGAKMTEAAGLMDSAVAIANTIRQLGDEFARKNSHLTN